MDTYHPDMAALAEQMKQKRQEQERRHAISASIAQQAQFKADNQQHDLLSAARMAGA